MVTSRQIADLLLDAVVESLEPCEPVERAARFARVELLKVKLAAMKAPA